MNSTATDAQSQPLPRVFLPAPVIGPRREAESISFDDPVATRITGELFELGLRHIILCKRQEHQSQAGETAPFNGFFLLLAGRMRMTMGGVDHEMQPGDLAFRPRGSTKGQKSEMSWYIQVLFGDGPEFIRQLNESGPYVRRYESADLVYLLTRRVLDAYHSRSVRELEFARQDGMNLLHLLQREAAIRSTKQDRRAQQLASMVQQIRLAPGDRWTVPRMAEWMNVSVSTLHRIFMREFHSAPMDLVVRERMLRAKHQLENTSATVRSIARMVGYGSISGFAHLFKKHIGRTPSQCRQGPMQPAATIA